MVSLVYINTSHAMDNSVWMWSTIEQAILLKHKIINNKLWLWIALRPKWHYNICIRNKWHYNICIRNKWHYNMCIRNKWHYNMCIRNKWHYNICIRNKWHYNICIWNKWHYNMCIWNKSYQWQRMTNTRVECQSQLVRPASWCVWEDGTHRHAPASTQSPQTCPPTTRQLQCRLNSKTFSEDYKRIEQHMYCVKCLNLDKPHCIPHLYFYTSRALLFSAIITRIRI